MEQTNMVSTEKMILTDTSLSENQGKDNRKRRKKGAKKKDVLASDDLIQHPEDGTCLETDTGLSNNINVSSRDECSMVKTNNILVEDVNRVPGSAVNLVSTIVESDGQVCSNNGSTGKGLSELLTEEKKKRKRKKGQNNLNNLRSNDVEYDRIDVPSIPNSAIENNSIRQATTSTSLVEHPLCNDLIHQPAVDTCLMKSDDNNKGSKGNHTKMDAKSSKSNIEVNVEPTFKVSGAYNPAGVDDVSGKSPMVLLQQQKPKRKKKKKNLNALTGNQIMPISCLMADSKMVQHNMEEGIPEEIHQNESATKDENCSGKDSIGLVDTQNNSISNAIPVSEGKNISNMQGGKKRKRKTPMKNLNLESKDGLMTSTDLSGEHQVKPAKLNANSTPEAIVNPICKVAEDDLACTDNVFGNMAMVPLQPQKTKRKKKKKKKNASATNPLAPCTGIIADSELLQHDSDPGIPQEIHQKNAEDDMACTDNDSGNMAMVPLQPHKTKRKKKNKKMKMNASTPNLLAPSTGIIADSELFQHDSDPGIPQEIHQKNAEDDMACTDNDSGNMAMVPLQPHKTKRKKIKKKMNASTTNLLAPSTGIIADSELFQHDSDLGIPQEIQQKNAEDDLACTDNISGNMAMVPLQPQKTKRKKKKKMNVSTINPLAPSTGIIADSELLQHDSDPGIPQEIHQKNAEDDMACTDNDSGNMAMVPLQPHKTKRKKKNKKMKMNVSTTNLLAPSTGIIADSELFQHDSDLGIPQEIHQKNAEDDLACTDNISGNMVMVPLQPQKTKRKKKKMNVSATNPLAPGTGIIADIELLQHDSDLGIPQEIHQDECATRDEYCSDKNSSGVISSETNSEPNVSSVSQGKALGNQKVEKKRKRQSQGTNLNLETKEGVISSTDVTGEQQLKAAKLDSDQNAAIGRTLTDCVRKKLLVLDLNGLLADVVEEKTGNFKADGIVSGKKVFKRPFCEDFLQFCFERFTVGVWSSRKKRNVDMVIDLTMGGKNRSRLAFIWDQSHCMQTGFKTIENREKPLFLKRLSQLWKNINKKLSGELEGYDKSNTLLLDDSPYKALQNPPYTAIFPKPYQYRDRNDNALGPGGDLRVYLEGLASAGDVQEYIKHNPFGQKAITESDPSWSFYVKVINYGSVDHNTFTPKETQSHLQPTELLQA